MGIREFTPNEALARQCAGTLIIDIRSAHEREMGVVEGALEIERAQLESDPGHYLQDRSQEVLLICQRGARSQQCAEALTMTGYSSIASIAGGTQAWEAANLPMRKPDIDDDFAERYSRHLSLPEVGLSGQRKLQDARVLLLGAGGLGSPAAFYLAAAGIGSLRLVDFDQVERSNLQRQILHTEASIGQSKVVSATATLSALNPRTRIEAVEQRATSGNVDRLLADVDVVIDGADNFPVRYLLNDACVQLGKPLVYGAVHRFEGQVSVFDAGRKRGNAPCYRCLFPQPPPAEFAPNCSEAGVLGVLPGVIGMLQATEAIKLILGIGQPLSGRLLHFDALAMRFRETRLQPDPDCPCCAPGREFAGYIDYERFCATA